jgi:lipopolysaccharide/colanic/teichoic acid biosynthesis glycosyltransferase
MTNNNQSNIYWISKRIIDVAVSILLIPIMIFIALILFILNRFFNKGPIFYFQHRMGKNCNRFTAIKFRSMLETDIIYRTHDGPLEYERITSLGKFLRACRLDEIPQIINVLKGEMSLIGPRPDYYEHALIYVKNIHGYKSRHSIRPGISGLSQIRLGYAEGLAATKKKSVIDNFYIQNASFKLDVKIFFGTIIAIFNRIGT